MKEEIIQFKGKGEGLQLILHERYQYAQIKEELLRMMQSSRNFFNKDNIRIMVSGKKLEEDEQQDLSETLNSVLKTEYIDFETVLEAQKKAEEQKNPKEMLLYLEKEAADAELFARRQPEAVSAPIKDKPLGEADSVFVCHTVRSGQRIQSEGDVVVIGDVNPGAELVAGGNIAVMGTLRGMAQAGCFGDEQAVVAANQLMPTQLRIAKKIAIPPEGEHYAPTRPEIARIRDGAIVIEEVEYGKAK
ncbi:MAG: septum site-determining protein MinC [Christensenellales bacterium]|jgi:septum site-determining protein MinC